MVLLFALLSIIYDCYYKEEALKIGLSITFCL